MKQAQFTNVSSVAIGGKIPGETFFLPCLDDGETPAELFWRKRIADGSVTPATQASPASQDDPKAAAVKKGK